MSELLPIGRFAQASRLSIKALRRYDADGLLVPAHVDPDSGYRYYTRDQVRRATAIALLRSLDVPLATIRGVLDAPDPRAALAGERARAERELERRRRNLRALERLLGAAAVLPYAVALAEQPALRLGGVAGEIHAETIGADVEPLAEAALARAAAEGWPQDDGLVGVYPLELTDPCTAALGVPVGDGVEAVAEVPGGLAATTVHVGGYDELPLAYATVLGWAHEHGHEPRGPVLETYLNDPRATPEHELATRVAVLLA